MRENEKEKEREMQVHVENIRIEADERKVKIQPEEAVKLEKMSVEKLTVETGEKYHSTEAEKLTKSNAGVHLPLPKLELKKFDGDVLKWKEFWDTYESTIHTNASLQNVDKFKYLKCHLTGQASDLVAGIDITNVNYDIAITLL